MNKEVRKHIISIMIVSAFLIVTTTCVYMPKHNSILASVAFLNNIKNFYMEDLSDGVLLKNASPIKDEEGMKTDAYKFKVVNNSNRNITYNIMFRNKVEDESIKLANKYLRYTLSTSDDTVVPNTLPENNILASVTIPPHSEQVYEFRMWLDYDCDNDAFGKAFKGSIEIMEIK